MKTTKKRKTTLRQELQRAKDTIDYQLQARKYRKNVIKDQRLIDKSIQYEQLLKENLRNVKGKKALLEDVRKFNERGTKETILEREKQSLLENFYGDEIEDLDMIRDRIRSEYMLNKLTPKELEEFIVSGYGSVRMEDNYYTKYEGDLERLASLGLDFLSAAIKTFIASKRVEGDIDAEKVAVEAQKQAKRLKNYNIIRFNAEMEYLRRHNYVEYNRRMKAINEKRQKTKTERKAMRG